LCAAPAARTSVSRLPITVATRTSLVLMLNWHLHAWGSGRCGLSQGHLGRHASI
jgi:hypothetical protein